MNRVDFCSVISRICAIFVGIDAIQQAVAFGTLFESPGQVDRPTGWMLAPAIPLILQILMSLYLWVRADRFGLISGETSDLYSDKVEIDVTPGRLFQSGLFLVSVYVGVPALLRLFEYMQALLLDTQRVQRPQIPTLIEVLIELGVAIAIAVWAYNSCPLDAPRSTDGVPKEAS